MTKLDAQPSNELAQAGNAAAIKHFQQSIADGKHWYLALLEAMATGMPVATLQNETSPIRDGSEGVVGSSVEDLREKVVSLLDDPKSAIAMGNAARERVEIEFPIAAFAEGWQSFASRLLGR